MANGIKALLVSAEPDGEGDALVTFRVPADARLYTGEYLLVQAFAVELAKAQEDADLSKPLSNAPGPNSQLGTQWRDIATAPKDGTAIILWPLELEDETRATVGHWYVHPAVQGFITPEIDCGDFEFEPTHWQPLPGGIE